MKVFFWVILVALKRAVEKARQGHSKWLYLAFLADFALYFPLAAFFMGFFADFFAVFLGDFFADFFAVFWGDLLAGFFVFFGFDFLADFALFAGLGLLEDRPREVLFFGETERFLFWALPGRLLMDRGRLGAAKEGLAGDFDRDLERDRERERERDILVGLFISKNNTLDSLQNVTRMTLVSVTSYLYASRGRDRRQATNVRWRHEWR